MLHGDVTSTLKKCVTLCGEGLNQAQIGKALKMSRRMTTHYFNKLKDAGFIRFKYRSVSNFYDVTNLGISFVNGEMLHQTPYGMREGITRRTHDLYLKYPIANPEDVGKLPGNFWDKAWRVKNGLKKSKYVERPIPMTLTLNQGWKTVSAQVHDFMVNNNNTTTSNIFKVSWNLFRMFAKLGLFLDVENMAVVNNHLTYEDRASREMTAQGKHFRVPLGRTRGKYTPNDPDQPAYVDLDNSPNANWETNDRLHDERRALMPEKVHNIEQGLNGLNPMLEKLTEQIELHLAATQEWKGAAQDIRTELRSLGRTRVQTPPEGEERRSTGHSEPHSEGKMEEISDMLKVMLQDKILQGHVSPEGLEKFVGTEEIHLEALKPIPKMFVPFRGALQAIGPFSPGARFYIDKGAGLLLNEKGLTRRVSG